MFYWHDASAMYNSSILLLLSSEIYYLYGINNHLS